MIQPYSTSKKEHQPIFSAPNNVSKNKQSVQFKDNRPDATTQLKVQQIANQPIQRQKNKTGMPDNLKSGIENLSGLDMSDVKVHYNSPHPAQLQAHAFAQGNQIHIASGQERHLPHEAWHVVQQKQGRVAPTKQLKGKVNINDDSGLEKEADVMGMMALQMKTYNPSKHSSLQSGSIRPFVTQRVAVPLTSSVDYATWTHNSGNVSSEWAVYNPTKNIKHNPPGMAFLHSFGNHKGKVDMMAALGTDETTAQTTGQQYAPPAHTMKTNSAWCMGLGHYGAKAIMSTEVSYAMLERQSERIRKGTTLTDRTPPRTIIYKSALTREIEGMTQGGKFVPHKRVVKGRRSISHPDYFYEVDATILEPTAAASRARLTDYQTASHGTIKDVTDAVVGGLNGSGTNTTTRVFDQETKDKMDNYLSHLPTMRNFFQTERTTAQDGYRRAQVSIADTTRKLATARAERERLDTLYNTSAQTEHSKRMIQDRYDSEYRILIAEETELKGWRDRFKGKLEHYTAIGDAAGIAKHTSYVKNYESRLSELHRKTNIIHRLKTNAQVMDTYETAKMEEDTARREKESAHHDYRIQDDLVTLLERTLVQHRRELTSFNQDYRTNNANYQLALQAITDSRGVFASNQAKLDMLQLFYNNFTQETIDTAIRSARI